MDDRDPLLQVPAAELTAHQAPALLVERVATLQSDGGAVELSAHQGLDGLQLLEACAQAVAVLTGARMRSCGDGQAASGMLVGAKAFTVLRCARPGERVRVDATLTHELGPVQLHVVSARGEDRDVVIGDIGDIGVLGSPGAALAHGELKVVRTGAP